MNNGHYGDLIVLSHLRWDFVFQRPQHLLTRFAKYQRVFYIEEPIFKEGRPCVEIKIRQNGVHVVVPYLPHGPGGPGDPKDPRRPRWPEKIYEKLTHRLLQSLIDELIQNHLIQDFSLWYYTPMAIPFTRHLKARAVVYDCMDELSLFKGAHPDLLKYESTLFQLADVVFTGGQNLYEYKKEKHPNVHPFPSSIDFDHFSQARRPPPELPSDQRDIPTPRIGFCGVIDERMDLFLLEEVAKARPDWHLIMIGPVTKIDPKDLPQRKNIHYLGPKSYTDLPNYIAGWDVAIMPFAKNESTRFISPTKTPEYLAAGRPVVSTSITDVVRPYGEKKLVFIADTPEDFVQSLHLAIELPRQDGEWIKRVDQFLGQFSWDKTWKGMSQLMHEAILRNQSQNQSQTQSDEGNDPKNFIRNSENPNAVEIWGGVECTMNRVGDNYFDQLKYNGHYHRIEDLDAFAKIGIKTLRQPFLWEHIAPHGLDQANWGWADERVRYLQNLGIKPIAGFVHHGSGPRYTELLDPEFPEKLSEFAKAFSERYPWIEDFTPINEIFTTARFSGLYGLWYPHKKTNYDCFKMLLNECRGTALCMQAIRSINPKARLIQTDDLGKVLSTPRLRYQADFENERRWLGWDLLVGKVTPDHPLWNFILAQGIEASELAWFAEHPCPPDIIGINHYLLSNRYLDENYLSYPQWSHSNNGKNQYCDIEAIRAKDGEFLPPQALLHEAWERYQIPLAITEVHLDGPREEQLRWFHEVWEAAKEVKQKGVDIRAITAWGLLGHFDWHCLVTRCEGYYESGVFDIRSQKPRPTALAKMIGSLNDSGRFDHPIIEVPGWWKRPVRVAHPEKILAAENFGGPFLGPQKHKNIIRPLIITGATGTLGMAFARICEGRGIPYLLVSRNQMDITCPESVEKVLDEIRPWGVINAAGYVRVDEAEKDQERCFRENFHGPLCLALLCEQRGISLLTFSSDLVFDGNSSIPYTESSLTGPLNVYGQSKAEVEAHVLNKFSNVLIVRTSAFFGPWDEYNFITTSLRMLQQGQTIRAASDIKISPTYVPNLVNTSLNLLIDGEQGLWHLANQGEISWADLAKEAAKTAHINPQQVLACSASELGLIARRPRFSVLGSERGTYLPSLDKALSEYFQEASWRM